MSRALRRDLAPLLGLAVLLAAFALLVSGGPASAGSNATPAPATGNAVRHFAQTTTLGFFRGTRIEYLDFGPVKLARGNRVAPIWAVTNGVAGQVNIVDTVPGRRDYTPLWGVRMVTFKDGVSPRLLTSAAAVQRAVRDGDVTVRTTNIVVNCPVL